MKSVSKAITNNVSNSRKIEQYSYCTLLIVTRLNWSLTKHSKTSFEKNCFSAWASTLNMGLINKVDMVCLSPVGYGV